MRQYNIPTLLQIMACRLIGAEPLSEPMLPFCQFDYSEQTSVQYQSKFIYFHSRKCNWKCRLENGSHFVSGSVCWTIVRIWGLTGLCMSQYRNKYHGHILVIISHSTYGMWLHVPALDTCFWHTRPHMWSNWRLYAISVLGSYWFILVRRVIYPFASSLQFHLT